MDLKATISSANSTPNLADLISNAHSSADFAGTFEAA
jgi:hypothetical protein